MARLGIEPESNSKDNLQYVRIIVHECNLRLISGFQIVLDDETLEQIPHVRV